MYKEYLDMKRKLLAAVFVSILFHSCAAGDELVNKLPAKTLLYGFVDVEHTLNSTLKYMEFADRELAGNTAFQIKEIHGIMKEFSARYEFTPGIFDHLHTLKLHFVILKKDKPEVVVRTSKYFTSKIAEAGGKPLRLPPELKEMERTYTETHYVTISGVFETTPELAGDFIEQFKGLMGRMAEKYPEKKADFTWKELETDRGELLSFGDAEFVLGKIDGYLVVSDGNPEELWKALVNPADPSLGSTNAHQRGIREYKRPIGYVLSNTRELAVLAEESLKEKLRQAKEKAEKLKKEGEKGNENNTDWRVRSAEQGLKTFEMMKKIIGFDKITMGSFYSDMSVKDKAASSRASLSLEIDESAPRLLKLALDSGRRFQAPLIGDFQGVCVMFRLGLKEMLDEVLKSIPPQTLQAFNMQMQMMKQMTGTDVSGLLAQLSGDMYMLIDIIPDKKMPMQKYNPETEKIETEIVTQTLPEFFMLFGLEDREAASAMLSKLFTTVSTQVPQAASAVKKRVYQETDIYCFGMGVDRKDPEPDGVMSWAGAVTGRHFTMGSWKKITGYIRQAKSAEKSGSSVIAQVISQNREANLIGIVPGAFSEKIEAMGRKEGDDPFKTVLREWEKMLAELKKEDQELAEKLNTPVKKLIENAQAMQKKILKPETAVMNGKLKGAFYEVLFSSEVRK